MAEHAPPAGAPAPPPAPETLAAPPPRARWIGESRVVTRPVEGPDGEVVEQEMERVPAEYVSGVPARDLAEAEYDALTAAQQALVGSCGLYELLAATPRTAAASGEGGAAPAPEGV